MKDMKELYEGTKSGRVQRNVLKFTVGLVSHFDYSLFYLFRSS